MSTGGVSSQEDRDAGGCAWLPVIRSVCYVIIPPVIGLSYQLRLDPWLERGRFDPDCIEINAEPFYRSTPHRLRWLSAQYPVIVRCASLSLGGPDPIEPQAIASCATIAHDANAIWLAHPLGFSRSGEIDLGMSVPISLTRTNLELVSERVREVIDRCERTLLIENGSSALKIRGTLAETEFLNLLCAQSGCKLLVDLSVLYADSRRHRFDPAAWLDDIEPQQIVQVRVTVPPERECRSSLSGTTGEQCSQLSRLLTRARPRAIVLAAPQSGPPDDIDRAWAQLRATVAGTHGDRADLC